MRLLVYCAFFVMISPFLSAADDEAWYKDFALSADVLGYGHGIFIEDGPEDVLTQFNILLNLDGVWQVDNHWEAGFQIQAGKGEDYFGLVDGLELTDLYLSYQQAEGSGWKWTLGSYDTPFGDQVSRVSNNAAMDGNSFFSNSLFYSAYGGVAGTLNTVGLLGEYRTQRFDARGSFSNGSGESAANVDGGLQIVLDFDFRPTEGWGLGLSWIQGEDSYIHDADGKGVDLQGGVLDLHWVAGDDITDSGFWAYAGSLQVSDEADIEEDLEFAMIEGRFNLGVFFLALRVSAWLPEDNDGSGSGVVASANEFNPAFAFYDQIGLLVPPDQDITRFQFSVGRRIHERGIAKFGLLYDEFDLGSAYGDPNSLHLIASMQWHFGP